jgi:hypothetical protein
VIVQSETWAWQGRTWSPVITARRPTARVGACSAYDEGRGRAVLYGGSDANGAHLDTWEFDGTNWQQVQGPNPGGRMNGAMAYDGVRGRVILFGGHTAAAVPQPLDDTWEWNGSGRA